MIRCPVVRVFLRSPQRAILVAFAIHPAGVSLAGGGDSIAPDGVPSSHPADRWEVALESGFLWNVGSNTSIDYTIVPTQITLRTPAHWEWPERIAGGRLVVRGRFSILMESILEGPETFYFGLAAAPSIEYWLPSERTSLFASIGGGIGWTDSTDVPGGQGQDFTLNWFAQVGVRQALHGDLSLLAGVYFIHHSNGGQTDPNPGIDALGFTAGFAWAF